MYDEFRIQFSGCFSKDTKEVLTVDLFQYIIIEAKGMLHWFATPMIPKCFFFFQERANQIHSMCVSFFYRKIFLMPVIYISVP